MIFDRIMSLFKPTSDPEINRLRGKVMQARKDLNDRLDKDSDSRDVARAMLMAIEEASK